ncbi:MAG: HYR domain-containing protein, partial [Flavobacteriaceae bacterium]
MKKITLLVCLLVFSFSFGQILNEQFDDNSGFTTSTPFFSDGFSDYFGLAVSNDYNGDSSPNNLKNYINNTGSYLVGMDLDGEGASLPITIDWTGLNIAGFNGIVFTGEFAEFFDNPGDIDAADYILVQYQIDGGGYQNLLSFVGADFSSGSNNGIFRQDSDFDGVGEGTALTGSLLLFSSFPIASTGNVMDLRMTISLNSGDEDFAVDNFVVSGNMANGTPPIIACPSNISVNNDSGLCSAIVNFVDAIAIDPDGDLDTVIQTMGPLSGSVFTNGDTTIEFTATDLAGNSSTCQFIITVIDAEDPIAMCQNITVELNPITGMAQITFADVDAGSTDNCGVTAAQFSQDTFSCADIGIINVNMEVLDAEGNIGTCTFEVTVEDNTAPVIICLGETSGASVFINELHYDNAGGDADEAVEIAGPAGTDLSTWSLVFYNGSNGQEYNNVSLSGIIDDEGNGFGAVNFLISGIQNGSPDGIVLANNNSVIEFISYEGTLTATDGIAMGMTSTDIGVSEPNSTPIGMSLQLSGTGSASSDFIWNSPTPSSYGSINPGQTIEASVSTPLGVDLDALGMATVNAADLIMSVDEACGYTVTIGGG